MSTEFGCVPEVGEIRVFKDQDAKRWFVAIYEANETWLELPHSSRDSLAAAEEVLFEIQEAQRGKAMKNAPLTQKTMRGQWANRWDRHD